jgi:hypothetical protein
LLQSRGKKVIFTSRRFSDIPPMLGACTICTAVFGNCA